MNARSDSTRSRGGAVILAAGASSRMGEPKALLRYPDGRSFVRAAFDALAAAGLQPIAAVLAHHREAIEAELAVNAGKGGRQTTVCLPEIVINPAPERGQISSLALGLAAIESRARFAAIALVDQPALPASVLAELLDAAAREPEAVHLPIFRGARGHPAIFPTSLASSFAQARAGESAREVIARLEIPLREHPVEEAGVLLDLDTPEELAAWRASEFR